MEWIVEFEFRKERKPIKGLEKVFDICFFLNRFQSSALDNQFPDGELKLFVENGGWCFSALFVSWFCAVKKMSKTKINDGNPSLCELLSPLSYEIFLERVLAQTSAVQNNDDTKLLQQIIIAKGYFLGSARWYKS